MVASMTGYGREIITINGREITVEIKSVNSRYFEYLSRLPKTCYFMDDKLKKLLNSMVSRGKIELYLTIQSVETDNNTVEINMDIAKAYLDAINKMATELNIKKDVSAEKLSEFPDVFVLGRTQQDEEQLWNDVKSAAQQAINKFIDMRVAEGEKLKEDILTRLEFMEAAVVKIEHTNANRSKMYYDKLYARLKELLEDKSIDDTRMVQEAAIFADKTAVDEETVRLRSHIAQYRDILKHGGPVGRKLDFLTQELNRETNTIGSKVQELELTKTVVEMKSAIEKIREQIQNLE